ncbi:MAG: hypothetical protein M3139_16265, partial [Bacteroidota bacterium]|nr:hypothetical protein [Bacteroidota bacterium]
KKLDKIMKELNGEAEVIYDVPIGNYIAVHEVFAHVNASTNEDCEKLLHAVLNATDIQKQRKTKNDPGDAIEQLEIIAWTSVSTAKSNPYPGLLTVRTIRNLLSVWDDDIIEPAKSPYSIVYNSDSKRLLFNSMETLAIASSESMQHMVFTEVLNSFAHLFKRLTAEEQRRAEDVILRMLSCMGDLVLTAPLEAGLEKIADVLNNCNYSESAKAVLKAKSDLAKSIGKLNSRSTRVGK